MKNSEKFLAIIQARMSSTRLPGKVLKKFSNGYTTLDYILKILLQKNIKTVIATTDRINDKAIEECYGRKYEVFRGSESDVLSRYTAIIEKHHPEYIIRICADNPFIFIEIIDKLFEKINLISDKDYYCFSLNSLPGMLVPFGVFVEIVRADALINRAKNPNNLDLEHVTFNLYPDGIYSKKCCFLDFEKEFMDVPDGLRLTMDTEEDFVLINRIITALNIQPGLNYKQFKLVVEYIIRNDLLGKMIVENGKTINSKKYRGSSI